MSNKKSNVPSLRDATIANVENRVQELKDNGFKLPKNYSVNNALQSAWLTLQDVQTRDKRKALEVCSRDSIAMSLFKMVQMGLNPAKNQCYFIPYGNTLVLSTSYFGNVLIGKRAGLTDVKANVIRKGDEFEYTINESGRKEVTKHNQPFENLDNEIVGAYCVVMFPDGTKDTDIMTIKGIKKSWGQGPTKGNSPAHKGFEEEMAKKTVTNRAIKLFVNSSDDGAIMDELPEQTQTEADTSHKIQENANKGEELSIEEEAEDIDYVEEVEQEEVEYVEPEPKQEEKPKPKAKQPKKESEPKQKQTIEFPKW